MRKFAKELIRGDGQSVSMGRHGQGTAWPYIAEELSGIEREKTRIALRMDGDAPRIRDSRAQAQRARQQQSADKLRERSSGKC